MEYRQYFCEKGGQIMKIAVCMKQVPATTEGRMDQKTGVLLRSGLEAVVNVYDLSALEAALRIQEMTDAEIHVFTMGPEKAEQVLREAYALGANQGWLICDSAFAGADVLATSYTLMQAIQSVGEFDMIFCGKQTTDGDTAQISGALAKWLEVPYLSWVNEIQQVTEANITVKCTMDQFDMQITSSFPCLLSIEKDAFIPRMPTLKKKISGRKKPIHVLKLSDFADQEKSHYGLSGSATRVERIFPPDQTEKRELTEMDGLTAASFILEVLNQQGIGEIK